MKDEEKVEKIEKQLDIFNFLWYNTFIIIRAHREV